MRRLFIFIALFFGSKAEITVAQPTDFKSGEATFVLKDDIKHPFFWWPATLLEYEVRFQKGLKPEHLVLTERETGRHIPFQITGPTMRGAGADIFTLNMISDLPSGARKTFVLREGVPEEAVSGITVDREGDYIVIKTNRLTIRIPATQGITDTAPGPVSQLFLRDSTAIGESVFVPGNNKLLRIETELVSSGSVFTAHRIQYLFEGDKRYAVTVKCINDSDFVELEESTIGIKNEENVFWRFDTYGFDPTHRQAPNHPYGAAGEKPGFERYEWETIDQKRLRYHHGVMPDPKEKGKIPYQVGLYEPWPAERTLTSALFWDERKNQSMGVFLTDAKAWNDTDYAIWHTSGTLNIQFYYQDSLLSYVYPVAEGTRATAMSCYAHEKDIAFMNDLEVMSTRPAHNSLGFNMRARMSQLSYNHFLQNRYGTIHLDKVKDWDLTYPVDGFLHPVIFKESKYGDKMTFLKHFLMSGYHAELAVSGPRQNSGYAPVPAREFNHTWVAAFNRFYRALDKAHQARAAALYLLHAYVAADEEYMPMKHMLSGHPNFLADVKTIPGLVAFQFPHHPEAGRWSRLFEKYVDVNTRYHTRPGVSAWDAQGGRWTENLGTYVWAFLRPTLRTAYVLKQSTGRNTVANASVAAIGSWTLHALSAPYLGESLDFYRRKDGGLDQHFWGIVTKEEGPRRIHPPQGAHSARRKPPSSLWFLGSMLENYDPLLAENLRYVARPIDDDMESFADKSDPFNIMFPKVNFDRGTKPDFKSVKFTGYGAILRSAVDTPGELSVHLCQIDKGPNYRWGVAGQGGSGALYFYAGGKSYSHNGREDSGDRRLQDTDLMTSFGVYKDGFFKSIGQNVLHRPMYDLGLAQFAELTSDTVDSYSWPEYQSRSVLLVGDDYFITYDDVHNNNITGRFSWFTHPDEELPTIEIVKTGKPRDGYKKTAVRSDESRGVWYDMFGDCLAFVSHKKDFKVESTSYGARITTPLNQTDYIFRNDQEIDVRDTDKVFTGTAGFMRVHPDGTCDLALFHGKRIGSGRFMITASDPDAGISARIGNDGSVSGKFYSPVAADLTFAWKEMPPGVQFFLDGKKKSVSIAKNGLTATLPPGMHTWQISKGLPIPVRPYVVSSVNGRGSVEVYYTSSAASRMHRVELSTDHGAHWRTIGETSRMTFRVENIAGVSKAHIRIVGTNKEHESEPSPLYPVYFTTEPPVPPDGLKVKAKEDGTSVTWGQVLGVSTYNLYRREMGRAEYELIYNGGGSSFLDKHAGDGKVLEYAVSGVNKNGESVKTHPVDNDPASWLQWNPKPGEPFRRANAATGFRNDRTYYPE